MKIILRLLRRENFDRLPHVTKFSFRLINIRYFIKLSKSLTCHHSSEVQDLHLLPNEIDSTYHLQELWNL